MNRRMMPGETKKAGMKKSSKRILTGTVLGALIVYGSFVGLWTPTGLECWTAETMGSFHGIIRSVAALGIS